MQFEWDEANTSHIARHGVRTQEAEQVIQNDPMDVEVRNGDEKRVLQLGTTDMDRILFVVVTERGEKLRVVTAYPASKKAQAFYHSRKAANDGQPPTDSSV